MKNLARVLTVLLLAVMVFGMLPAIQPSVEAAGNPILVISSNTAVNPILDHVLSSAEFSSGGPFTVSFDWKCDLKPNDPTKSEYFASVIVEGTIYGSATQLQTAPGYRITGSTNWQTKSFQFQNVGVYNVSGSNMPGGILRFFVLYAKGELQVRNIVIKNAAGTVKYNLNTDPVVAQAMTNMRNSGMTECDMGELAAIDYENCPWVAGQFSTGSYSSFLREDSTATQTTTSSLTRPTTKAPTNTTKAPTNTTKAPTNTTKAPTNTTKAPTNTTKAPTNTTVPSSQNTTSSTTRKPTSGVTDPCARGHNYVNGFCTRCGITQPGYKPPVQTVSTSATTNPTTFSSSLVLNSSPTFTTVTPEPSETQPTTQPLYDDGYTEKEETGTDYTLILIVLAVVMCGGVFILILLLLIKMSKNK